MTLASPKLPAIQPVAKAGGVAIKATNGADWMLVAKAGGGAIKATNGADWMLVAHGRAWVAGLGKGVGVYDARTGRPLGSVAVPQVPCAAGWSGGSVPVRGAAARAPAPGSSGSRPTTWRSCTGCRCASGLADRA
jgi:hypothetical protein